MVKIKIKGCLNIAFICCIVRLAEQRLDLKLSLPSPEAELLPAADDHDQAALKDRILSPKIMRPSSMSCQNRPATASYVISGPSSGSSMLAPEQAGTHSRWTYWLPSAEKDAGMISTPIWPRPALGSSPASLSPPMNPHITKFAFLDPEAGERSSLPKKTPTWLSAKKCPMKASTSNALQQKCKKKGKGVYGLTPDPTLPSNGIQPMKTRLGENVYSNQPHDHDRLQSQVIQPMETTREENLRSSEPHGDNSTPANVNSSSPGMIMMTTAIDSKGTSRQSDATSILEALQLIERMKNKHATCRSSDYCRQKRRRRNPRLASYINRELPLQGEKDLSCRQALMAAIFDISVTLADGILFQYGYFASASSQHHLLPSLHLTHPESAASKARCRGNESARKYLRRMNKSVLTSTLLSIHLIIICPRDHWGDHGPVPIMRDHELIQEILQDLHSFYQDIITHGKYPDEHPSSHMWTARLKNLLQEKEIRGDMFSHTPTNKRGLVWHIVNQLVALKIARLGPAGSTNTAYVDRMIKQAVSKIIYFSKKEKKVMAQPIPNHIVI
ncbi:hypothetical protein PCANC_26425 [Puccinia coronata f. sp. avenae]|uniref:Uncharacterized protein n=1 Tax=Puccinia coronata f. sp. avenae TaxID=200324 RepID=A0A2N5UW71_9BASI|nr:hypothetical protein PCANC_26425 [Puccinia coronata f. sp. avenae]PLW42005.1 hypothetical protein PCASD_10100 [Puccinia coronata f. sp. avenae]